MTPPHVCPVDRGGEVNCWEEHDRCKRAVEALRSIGYPARLGRNGVSVEVSSQAAERVIQRHRPKFRLGPLAKHNPGPAPKDDPA